MVYTEIQRKYEEQGKNKFPNHVDILKHNINFN